MDAPPHDWPAGRVDLEFSFAFQPIVDADARQIVSFEALLRGPRGESSTEVFARVPRPDLYRFDQACRLKAIQMARHLHLETRLNLNLFPDSGSFAGVSVAATLEASLQEGFPPEKLIFEVSEAEWLHEEPRIGTMFSACHERGFQTAIDDFGAGYSGLRMLADYQPNYIKLDRNLISDIHQNRVKQIIVKGIASMCRQLSITAIVEGVERAEEYRWLRKAGVHLFQGYYFARPAFEALCDVRPALF
jgi:EAL domain-containing protein (putative c-di-GMP-specific phosphodiesterase class I)